MDREWQLALKPDSTFNYILKTLDTRASKKDSTKMEGNWQLNNDTLKLSRFKEKEAINFLIKKDKLIPIGQKPDTITNFIIALDYLGKK